MTRISVSLLRAQGFVKSPIIVHLPQNEAAFPSSRRLTSVYLAIIGTPMPFEDRVINHTQVQVDKRAASILRRM